MKNIKNHLKLASLLFIAVLSLVTIFTLTTNKSYHAADSATFSLVKTSKDVKLGKKKEINLEINYLNNSTDIYYVDIELFYDSKQFDLKDKKVNSNNVLDSNFIVSDPIDAEGTLVSVQVIGIATNGITSPSGKLLNFTLISKKGEANTAISFKVNNIGILNEETGRTSYGQINIGLSSVNFVKSTIPWWVWLIIVGGLILAIAGGYVFHLFLPDTLSKAYQASKKFAVEAAKRTAELANRVFNRRPVAPKMKPSTASTNSKPVQPVATKKPEVKAKVVEPAKVVDNKPEQFKPNSNVTTGVPLNVTTIKTRVVNPDGSVTTVTKKVANPVNLNGTDKDNK